MTNEQSQPRRRQFKPERLLPVVGFYVLVFLLAAAKQPGALREVSTYLWAIGGAVVIMAIPLGASVGLAMVGTRRTGPTWTERTPRIYPMAALTSVVASRQPMPPRDVPFSVVIGATLRGLDGVVYLAAGIIFFSGGVFFTVMAPGIWPIDLAFLAVGGLSLSLPGYRIWSVTGVLRSGVASLVEVTDVSSGRARLQGTPWGDVMNGIAARGAYRTSTGELGAFYLQQQWALSLKPGDQMWVLKAGRGPTLYAPSAAG